VYTGLKYSTDSPLLIHTVDIHPSRRQSDEQRRPGNIIVFVRNKIAEVENEADTAQQP